MKKTPPPPTDDPSVAAALDLLVGPSILLDSEMRVVCASPSAVAILGSPIPRGESAPKLLCGARSERPLPEALSRGTAVRAVIPHPGSPDERRRIEVNGAPLGEGLGSLLSLREVSQTLDEGPIHFHGMWTQDAGTKQVFRIIERVAAEDVTVLVRGETGAGKELVAQALHAISPRSHGPFRAINCAALPPNLLESELFGHARGAFTGAVRDVPGHIVLASRGTLFLDEVAEMPLELQAKLLRVLETRTVIPVGGRDPIPVDVRIVSATHRALRKEVEAGRFRADLMYRLRVIPIFLPPLRERPGDVRLLCERFLLEMNQTRRRTIDRISPAALSALERYDWPGNIRELKNVLSYAYAIGDGPVLLASDLPPEVLPQGSALPEAPTQVRDEAPEGSSEQARILRALERAGGNRGVAARILGWSRVTLWRRMRELGLEDDRKKPSSPST